MGYFWEYRWLRGFNLELGDLWGGGVWDGNGSYCMYVWNLEGSRLIGHGISTSYVRTVGFIPRSVCLSMYAGIRNSYHIIFAITW